MATATAKARRKTSANTESEHQKDGRGSAGSRGRRAVEVHTEMRRENEAAVASESTQTRRGKDGPQLPSLLTKPGTGILYAVHGRYRMSTLRAKVSKKRRNKRRTSMPATRRAASYAKKSGLRILKCLLNRREVLDVERNSDGGEKRYGET